MAIDDESGQFHVDTKRSELPRINEIVENECDILLFTSTITAGVSIDTIEFDTVIGYLHENTATALDCI